jgi:hypothetical protein
MEKFAFRIVGRFGATKKKIRLKATRFCSIPSSDSRRQYPQPEKLSGSQAIGALNKSKG